MGFEVDDVITQATTEELSKLVCGDGNWHTSGVERLGVPRVHMADGPHGLRVEETAALGTELARKLNAATGPVAIFIPRQGMYRRRC